MNRETMRKLAYFFLFLSFLIAFHQYIGIGSFWEMKDVHHELFIAMFGFSGILLYLLSKSGE